MQKEFWHVQCPGCTLINRLTIKGNHDQVEVTCPRCKKVFRTKIVSAQELNVLRDNLRTAIREALSRSAEVADAIQEVHKSWLDIELVVIGNVAILTKEGFSTTDPVIDDTGVAFDEKDINWAKKLHIKLDA